MANGYTMKGIKPCLPCANITLSNQDDDIAPTDEALDLLTS